MPKFLVDESLSPLLASFLRNLGYDAFAVREVDLRGKSDEEIVSFCKRNKRVILTNDLDFGQIFYFKEMGEIGVVLLRSRLQGYLVFQKIISRLHSEGILKNNNLPTRLIVATEAATRSFPPQETSIS